MKKSGSYSLSLLAKNLHSWHLSCYICNNDIVSWMIELSSSFIFPGKTYTMDMCFATGRQGLAYVNPKGKFCWFLTPNRACPFGAKTETVSVTASDLNFNCNSGNSHYLLLIIHLGIILMMYQIWCECRKGHSDHTEVFI